MAIDNPWQMFYFARYRGVILVMDDENGNTVHRELVDGELIDFNFMGSLNVNQATLPDGVEIANVSVGADDVVWCFDAHQLFYVTHNSTTRWLRIKGMQWKCVHTHLRADNPIRNSSA